MKALVLWVCVAVICYLPGGCSYRRCALRGEAPATPSEETNCGPGLSEQEIIEVIRAAVKVSGGDPSRLILEYEIRTLEQGCDYFVLAVSSTSTNHFSLLIDRLGQIKTWPWCCEPAYFVPPLKPRTQ